jgi:hypothetical protein
MRVEVDEGGPAQGLSDTCASPNHPQQGAFFADDFGCSSSEVTLARSHLGNIAEA